MACDTTASRRVRWIAAALCVGAMALLSVEAFALTRSSQRPLGWESHGRSSQSRHRVRRGTSIRRVKVSRDTLARLKKSTFWNRRSYQFATPIIEGGRLYVGVDARRFYAIDVPKGKKRWEVVTEGPVQSKAAFSDGTIYVGDAKGIVYALDAEDGSERWRARLDSEVLAQPLVVGDRVYVADLSGRLYALDRSGGTEVWHTNPADRGIGFSVRRASGLVEVNGLILMGTAAGSVMALRATDGQVAWVRQIGNRQSQVCDVDGIPVLDGGRAYVASADGQLAALDPSTGEVLWTADVGGANDLLVQGGRLYASGGGVLSAVDPQTGAITWQQDLQTPEISSPVTGDHYVAVVSTVDKLFLIDDETGDILYDRFVHRGSFGDPAVSDGRLYLLSNATDLYTFRVRELPPKKAAPKPPASKK